jgi:hypothetical protein
VNGFKVDPGRIVVELVAVAQDAPHLTECRSRPRQVAVPALSRYPLARGSSIGSTRGGGWLCLTK